MKENGHKRAKAVLRVGFRAQLAQIIPWPRGPISRLRWVTEDSLFGFQKNSVQKKTRIDGGVLEVDWGWWTPPNNQPVVGNRKESLHLGCLLNKQNRREQ